MSARAFLKAQTAAAHDALDAHFGAYDLADRGQYAEFLSVHAAALFAVERALEEAGVERIMPQWPAMRRSLLIQRDLDALGTSPASQPAIARLQGEAEILGALYVLEGSRLGGKLLMKAVGQGFPVFYLGHQPPLTWPQFVAEIERTLQSGVDRGIAAQAANRVFAAFLDAAGVSEGLERDEQAR